MKNHLYIIFACFLPSLVSAQDYHSSNLQNISQLYNPALVALKTDMSAAVSYRTQWRAVGSPFTAMSASFASTVEPFHRKSEGHLAVGFNAYREQMSRQGSATSVSMNVAQHISLSKTSSLSLGLNFGVYGTAFNEENGAWESQHNGLFYDENLASGEVFESNQQVNFDVGSGIVYAVRSRNHNLKLFQFGLAAFHLNRPDISFMSDGSSKLPIRTVLYSTFAIPIGKRGSHIEGSMLYQNQMKFNSFTLGAMAKIKLVEKAKTTSSTSKVNEVYAGLGMYFRGKDALIFNAQIQKTNWTASLAYDITVSSLKNNSKGAIEVQLSYTVPTFRKNSLY
jgi:type IX secretion system PorP/SprF family membrane protein